MPYYPTRKLTILALDPSVRLGESLLKTQVEIPNETLEPGPLGYRVHVVDFDSTSNDLYMPAAIGGGVNRDDVMPLDPFAAYSDTEILSCPDFHAFMAYGVVVKTLSRFEYALGRRVGWSFGGHQIQVAPHAFADANAFYDPESHSLMFGYFLATSGKRIFTCLSHEIIAHETTHALLDGLRERYTDPSSPQQAGFHEGFADIIALLSILSAQEVVACALDQSSSDTENKTIARSEVTPDKLRSSALLGLASQMGEALSNVHGQALRRSVQLRPSSEYLSRAEYEEPHMCGEVLVAAVLNAFLSVWTQRLAAIGDGQALDRKRVAEEGAEIAERLLTVCVRAIDYCPPTDLQFGDFASAVLTADWELNPRDDKYEMRTNLLTSFRAYGINPSSPRKAGQEGAWEPPPSTGLLQYDRTHFESMRFDLDEVFRFIWENRIALKLDEQAYTRVLSVRPCVRTGRDGFVLRETVVEYHQELRLNASELAGLDIQKPAAMPDSTEVRLYGGNALIFDEYGRLKYSIGNSIRDPKKEQTQKRQSDRLAHLWRAGHFDNQTNTGRGFANMHRRRSTGWFHEVKIPEAQEP